MLAFKKLPVTIILLLLSLGFVGAGLFSTQNCEGTRKSLCDEEIQKIKNTSTSLGVGQYRPAMFSNIKIFKMVIFISASLIPLMVMFIGLTTNERPYAFLSYLTVLFLPSNYALFIIPISSALVFFWQPTCPSKNIR